MSKNFLRLNFYISRSLDFLQPGHFVSRNHIKKLRSNLFNQRYWKGRRTKRKQPVKGIFSKTTILWKLNNILIQIVNIEFGLRSFLYWDFKKLYDKISKVQGFVQIMDVLLINSKLYSWIKPNSEVTGITLHV